MNRRTVAIGILWLVALALVAGIVGIGWYLWNERDDWLLGILFVVAFASGLAALASLLRMRRNEGLAVLWCRRFATHADPSGQRNRWNQLILARACRDLAVPVTLRDDSVGWSHAVEDATGPPLTIALLGFGLAFCLLVGFPLIERWADYGIVYLGAIVATCALVIAAIQWLTTSLGSFRGTPEAIRELLEGILDQRHWPTEALVVRCTDEDWQAHVGELLRAVSFVIIDVTGESPNVDWEVERSLERLGSERVLFLRESPDAAQLECDRSEVPTGVSVGAQNPVFLRYGRGWVGEERKAYFKSIEERPGGSGVDRLGERAREIAAELARWMRSV